MSFWSSQKLLLRLPQLVSPFDLSQVDCNAYTLKIGSEVYISPSGDALDKNTRTIQQLESGQAFAVPPGQFAFLITEEIVEIPPDAMAFISMKAAIKFRGLVNVSGFHVDPGYRGRLIFSVFNAGPSVVHLRRGQGCFLIWFTDLDQASDARKNRGVVQSEQIDTKLIAAGELLSLEILNQKLKSIEQKQAGIDGRTTVAFAFASALLVGAFALLIRALTAIS